LMPKLIWALAEGAKAKAEKSAPATRRVLNPRIWNLSYGGCGSTGCMGYGGFPSSHTSRYLIELAFWRVGTMRGWIGCLGGDMSQEDGLFRDG
jgi:hypothetical protein